MRLIVTRPEPDATRTCQALSALGHAPLLSPMLDIVAVGDAVLPERDWQAVLVTSSNAVRALAAHPRRDRVLGLPVYAVGDRTALEARRAGFLSARSAGGAVDDLVALVEAELDPGAGPLLHGAGASAAGNPAARLEAMGFELQTVVLYRALARRRLSDAAEAALRAGAVEGVLLYSRRSATAFAAALRAAGLAPLAERVACFCLSTASAEPMTAVATGPVAVARQPDQISLFALIEAHAG